MIQIHLLKRDKETFITLISILGTLSPGPQRLSCTRPVRKACDKLA